MITSSMKPALGGDEGVGEALFRIPSSGLRSSRDRRGRNDRGSRSRPWRPSRRSRPSARRSFTSAPMCLDAMDVIGAAIGLARDQRHHGDRRLAIGEEQLGAVLDDAGIFLAVPAGSRARRRASESGSRRRRRSGRNAPALREESMSRQPARTIGWLATTPTVWPSMRMNPVMMLRAKLAWEFKEIASSAMAKDSIPSCRMAGGTVRDQAVEPHFDGGGVVMERPHRRLLAVVQRKKSKSRRTCSSASTSFS